MSVSEGVSVRIGIDEESLDTTMQQLAVVERAVLKVRREIEELRKAAEEIGIDVKDLLELKVDE